MAISNQHEMPVAPILVLVLNESKIGCNVNDVLINHMFYANDSVLMAPNPIALQKLLDICYEYSNLNLNIILKRHHVWKSTLHGLNI